jgi:hypothetical protein
MNKGFKVFVALALLVLVVFVFVNNRKVSSIERQVGELHTQLYDESVAFWKQGVSTTTDQNRVIKETGKPLTNPDGTYNVPTN